MVLKLRKEKRGVHVGVAVVNLWVVGLGATSCSEWRHSMRTGIFAQGSQCWGVGA